MHIEALMPEHHTDHEEAYLCTSVLLPDEPLKLVGVEPLSKQEVVHHMLMFGEATSILLYHLWDCREGSYDESYDHLDSLFLHGRSMIS